MIKYKYNPIKRTFNLLAAILGIFAFAAVLFLIAAIVASIIDGLTSQSSSTQMSMISIILGGILTVSGLVFTLIYFVVSIKLCKKPKKNFDGEYDNRKKINVLYIVSLILAVFFIVLALMVGAATRAVTNTQISMIIIITSLAFILLLALQIIYMTLPIKVIDKSKYLKVGDDAEIYSCIAKDLKKLYYDDVITKEQFVFAFDKLTEAELEV